MVGAFSDNQPDYSWIKPYEVKTFGQCWYPIREIASVKNANLNGAVNLALEPDGAAKVGFNTSRLYRKARVVLAARDEETITIGPGQPFTASVSVPRDLDATDLRACFFSASGAELVAYQPVERPGDSRLPSIWRTSRWRQTLAIRRP